MVHAVALALACGINHGGSIHDEMVRGLLIVGTHTGDPAPFCVSGNMLRVRGGDGTLVIATKN
jgi:hypothetical protein